MLKSYPLWLLLLLATVLTRPTITFSQNETLSPIFTTQGAVYFRFDIQERSEISTLTKIISIDNVQGNTVTAFANKNEFARFLALGYTNYTILPNPNAIAQLRTSGNTTELLEAWNVYPTYEAYEALMAGFVANYPELCHLENIGTLPSGRKLLVLKISDNVNKREDEPQFLYTSSMHGDEIAGYVGMLHYIDYLLSRYGTDPRVTYLVDNMEIWINPLANPDGTYRTGNNSVNGAVRYNANNVDLNRNYPDPQDGPHPDGNSWQPETMAFMAFADTMNFVMAANFHGGAEVVNYPWDTWTTDAADVNWWIDESTEYADTAMTYGPSGYLTSVTNTGYVNGYVWYEVNGGRQDYMNYFRHCREVTIELSNTKLLEEGNLLTNWEANYRSWLNYMEEALHGFRGVVKDACTGKPLVAKVFIEGHDKDNSFVVSGLPVGDYHRPVFPGTYTVTFSAPGYVSQTITGVSVTPDAPAVVVNVNLTPEVPVAAFEADAVYVCGDAISFKDLTGSASAWEWSFDDGSVSNEQNPTHTWMSSGTYSVTLAVSNCAGADTLVKSSYVTLNIPKAPQVVGGTACPGSSTMLVAFGEGSLHWYDAPSGGNLLSEEAGFITPPLTATTTYYVESDQSGGAQMVGPQDNTIGTGGFYTAGTYHYLRFNAELPFQLISVWVNANTTANRTIQLRDASGTVLESATINIPAGQSRIDLGFHVPAGSDLQLGVAGGNNLYRNQSGASYPYNIDGLVSITGNSAGNQAIYYYFYDWEVQQMCTSPRVPVTATVLPAPPTPVVNQVGSALTSGVPMGNQWYSTTNGIIPGANAPVFTPSASGEYYVVVTDANGCTAASAPFTMVLTGTTDPEASIQVDVFPNPSSGVFYVTSGGFSGPITIYNSLGETMLDLPDNTNRQVTVNAANWPAGLYMVAVKKGNGVVVWRKMELIYD